jgi:PAS domain S-box-containing protein
MDHPHASEGVALPTAAPASVSGRAGLVSRASAWLSTVPDPPRDLRLFVYPALLVALGTVIGIAITEVAGVTLPAPIIIAVLISTWYGGVRSGLVAWLLGIISVWLFLAEPRASFEVRDATSVVLVLTFAGMAMIFGLFYESARDAQRRSARATADVLDLVGQQRALSEQIVASEERYSSLAETMPAHVVITGADGGFEYCNQSYFDYTGLTFEQATNWRGHAVIHPDDYDAAMERWASVLTTGEPLRSEMRLRRHDGEYRWFLVNGRAIRDGGEIRRWITVSVDIDDRKRAEADRDASEQRASVALAAAGMGGYELDLSTSTAIWDSAQAALFDLDPGDTPSPAAFLQRVHPDDRQRVQSVLEQVARDGGHMQAEFRVVSSRGNVRWLAGWAHLVDTGGRRRIIGVNQDITERRREEARRDALAEASQQFVRASHDLPSILDLVARRVVDAIGDQCGIRLLSDDGERLETTVVRHRDPAAGEFLARMLGPARERDYGGVSQQVLTSGATFFEPRIDPAALKARVRPDYWPYLDRFGISGMIIVPLRAGAENIGTMTLTRDPGSDPYTLDDASFAEEMADRAALAIQNARLFEDLRAHVLDVQQALAERAASEDRMHLAAAAARLGTWEWDLAQRVVWSESLERIHGYAPGAFPQTFAAMVGSVHPDDREMAAERIGAAVASGEDLDFEHRVVLPNGEIRWLNGRGRLQRDANGKPQRMMGICMDITDRVEQEHARERLLADLAAANAAKDEFLGLVSHELKTPITTILGNAYVLEKRGDRVDEQSRAQALRDIHHDADRLHRIIDNLLVLARVEQGQRIEAEPMIVGRLVERLVAEHQRQHPERKITVVNVGNRLPVTASPFHVEHVFRNLLSNAEKYSADGAPIEVRIVRTDREVRVSVLDRGAGIPDDEREAVFTPFYRSPRTAGQAAGIGIGLAVCKRLIESEGGRIWTAAREGGGSEFGFAFPAQAGDAATDEGAPGAPIMTNESLEPDAVSR